MLWHLRCFRARAFSPMGIYRILRADYYVNLPGVKPNFLALYHLGLDSYVYYIGQRLAIHGTRGLTVNGGINITKKFKNNNRLKLLAATSFIARSVRANSLTRKAVVNLQYSIAF